MTTLLTSENVTFVLAAGFVVCIIAAVFQLMKTTEKMGDDIK